ncbi:GNAT family N-acetyltransferase [Zooshikella ganghwensis]|uniref:GNAT family N-acetyltransferase n=1 Tax=Zooshikella ganghwensis TaxID=202772 RepID=UPI00042A5D3C|nr:N-acetyltransferase [Zooshikella ganghwensis]
MTDIVIKRGWDIGQSTRIATLYDEAFGFKFSGAIANKEARVRILSKSFIPDFSYVAFVDHEIVGLAGFQAHYGSFTGGMSLSVLIDELGVASGIWAATVLSLFERKPKAQELIMDGIVVDSKFRGKGIGSMLLDSIVSHAGKNGYDSVRLDVIDSNPRAKSLYETKGFVATHKEHFPYLEWLIGFTGSTTMVKEVGYL